MRITSKVCVLLIRGEGVTYLLSNETTDSASRAAGFLATDGLLQSYLMTKPLEWVSSLKFFQLDWSVLVKELVNREKASAHSDLDFVFLDTYCDFL